MTNYFIDSEFLEDGHTIMPISLGIVAEDGRELYLEFIFDEERVLEFRDSFVREHVLPHLQWAKEQRVSFTQARDRILGFLGPTMAIPPPSWRKPVFWGYYADYDWVLLCRLWGRMIDLPPWMPKFCMDLQQWWVQLGSDQSLPPPKPGNEHHALADARWHRDFHARLQSHKDPR